MATLLKKDYGYSNVLWEDVIGRVKEIIRDEYNISPYISPELNTDISSPFRVWIDGQETNQFATSNWYKEYSISINQYFKVEKNVNFYKRVYQDAERLYEIFFHNMGSYDVTTTTYKVKFYNAKPESVDISQEGEYFRIELIYNLIVNRDDNEVYIISSPSTIRARTRAIEPAFNFWSLDFDGTDDEINTGLEGLSSGSSFTFSVWINGDTFASTDKTIISNGLNTNHRLFSIEGGKLFLRIYEGGYSGDDLIRAMASTTFSTGVWYNAVATYDGTNIKLYINGEEETTTVDGAGSAGSVSNTTTVGYLLRATKESFFNGQMSETAIFNSALSSSEIESIYNNGQPILLTENQGGYKSSSNLVAYYRMGSGSGDDRSTNGTISDQSVNANNGTMVNFDSLDFRTNVPQIYDKALFSNSLVFDGTDDYIDLGDKTTSLQSNGFTFAAWIYPHDLSNTQFFISGDENENNIRFNGNGYQLFFEINNKGTTIGTWSSDSDGVFVINQWQHLVVTYDNGTVTIYRNGNPVTFDTGGTTYSTDTGATEFKYRHIGKRYGIASYYDGGISDIAIFNTDLDATNVTAIYNSGKPIDLTCDAGNYNNANNMVGYWKMGDGYLDELPSATNQGVIYDQVTPILDDNMVGNGDFSNSTNWSIGGGWAISGETLIGTSTVANANRTGLTIAEGKAYKLSFEITSYTSGSVDLGIGGTNGTLRSAIGSYEEYIIAGSGANLTVNGGTSFTGVVDNVKAQLVNGNPGLTNAMNASAQSTSVPE